MFERLERLIGKENLEKIQKEKILIVGLGGVGGMSAVSLVRSGISRIVLIDFDTVDITNLNRQEVAYQSTIGKKKVAVMEKIIKDINPECEVTSYDIYLEERHMKELFDKERPTYVIDACDSKETKKSLILECLARKIPFLSSMGTGNKMDPFQLEITDIRKTVNDPLARIFRSWVKQNHISEKILVLSSKELPKKTGPIVASNSFVPNTAGLLITSYVINDILGNKIGKR